MVFLVAVVVLGDERRGHGQGCLLVLDFLVLLVQRVGLVQHKLAVVRDNQRRQWQADDQADEAHHINPQ